MVVDRGVHTVTLLNRYPYNNGHLLVAPQRHLARLDELGDELQLELSQTITRMVGRAGEGAAAAGVQRRA